MAVHPVGRRVSVKCPTVMPETSVSDPAGAGTSRCACVSATAPASVPPNSRLVNRGMSGDERPQLLQVARHGLPGILVGLVLERDEAAIAHVPQQLDHACEVGFTARRRTDGYFALHLDDDRIGC